MRYLRLFAVLIVGLPALCALAQDGPASSQPATVASEPAKTVAQRYPNLASAALTYARPAQLPEGVVLRAGELVLTQADIDDAISKSPEAVREQLHRNGFFMLEQMATRQLLADEARSAAAADGKDTSALSEQQLIDAHLGGLAVDVAVTDAEITEFYQTNTDTFGGQKLEQVRDVIVAFLKQQKQQEGVNEHIKTLGQRRTIEISAEWLRQQAALAVDNPVDRARASGRPSLVDFGSQGCIPCDKLAPILEAMKTKYDGRANVLFVSVRQEQILTARYGIQTIPVQVFFDAGGREVFRHTGFWPQEELEKKLAEVGVKQGAL